MTAKNIVIATGSVPFVPPGITVDGTQPHNTAPLPHPSRSFRACPNAGKTVITSDHALKLEWVPEWVGIIGSG